MATNTVLRVVVQRVSNASLLMNNVDEWRQIGEGVIFYVSFLKGAKEDDVPRIVKNLFETKFYLNGACLADSNPDLMIIPQASLAGKQKQKNVQFHSLVGKEEGLGIYTKFCEQCKEQLKENAKFVPGTYGNRQGLKFESDGPYSHFFEI